MQEEQELRLLLCRIHMYTPFLAGIFFTITTFFSFLWRSFLILHARGFIRNGQINLKLFSQLYWLITISFCCLALTPNLVLNFTGKFPSGSVRGQVCLFLPLNSEPQKKGENKVINLMLFFQGFNSIAYIFYLGSRSKRLIKILCPGGKMCCIGLYKRNVLDYRETAAISVAWAIMNMFYAVNIELYKYLNLSPRVVFFMDTFYYTLVFEIITLSIVFALSSRDFPVYTKPAQIHQFYVTFPEVLVPRLSPHSRLCPILTQVTPVTKVPRITQVLPLTQVPLVTQVMPNTQVTQITQVAVTSKKEGKGKNRKWVTIYRTH